MCEGVRLGRRRRGEGEGGSSGFPQSPIPRHCLEPCGGTCAAATPPLASFAGVYMYVCVYVKERELAITTCS